MSEMQESLLAASAQAPAWLEVSGVSGMQWEVCVGLTGARCATRGVRLGEEDRRWARLSCREKVCVSSNNRVKAGLATARAKGKVLGRPRRLVDPEQVRGLREDRLSLRAIAKTTGVSTSVVRRVLERRSGK